MLCKEGSLVRISAPHFVAGYVFGTHIIAPIIKYMKGWPFMKIVRYAKDKGWEVELFNN